MTNSDRQFINLIKRETGRQIEKAPVRCDMCDGLGFSMWEPTCMACAGEGVADEWVYLDCNCRVEVDENCDQDCQLCFAEPIELEAAA
jgi:DnaJ-class molecular chaperone